MAKGDLDFIDLDADELASPSEGKRARAIDIAETGPQQLLFGDDRAVAIAFASVFASVFILKLILALTGNVLWEEAHFVVAGEQLTWGYPDIPPGWPALAAAVTDLFGWSKTALRLTGLLVASLIPLGVWFLAKPLVGNRNALWAGAIACVFPPVAANGTIFYTESGLQLALVFMLGFLVRAIARDKIVDWALAGLCAALGLLVHYRFGLAGIGIVAALLITTPGRKLLLRPGVWLTGAIAFGGLVPSIIYNLAEHGIAVDYHLVRRQVYTLYPEGLLLHLGEQFMLATPTLFIAMLALGWGDLRRAALKDARFAICLAVAIAYFGFFTALSPFYKTRLQHWPFMAYLPLLPFVPGALIAFVDSARGLAMRGRRAFLVALGPVIGVAVMLIGGGYHFMWAKAADLPWQAQKLLFLDMGDWTTIAPLIDRLRARIGNADAPIAVGGHVNAVRVEFPGQNRRVYALREPRDDINGMWLMRAQLGLDETGLTKAHAGRPTAILLRERAYLYHEPTEVAYRQRLCGLFSNVQRVDGQEIAPGRIYVDGFIATPRANPVKDGGFCGFFPTLYLARPERADTIPAKGINAFGIAASAVGIERVDVLIDGKRLKSANIGLSPSGFRAPAMLAFDPSYPAIQFDFTLNGTEVDAGPHRLSLVATRKDGSTETLAARLIYGEP